VTELDGYRATNYLRTLVLEPAKDNQVLKTIEIELFPEDKIMTWLARD